MDLALTGPKGAFGAKRTIADLPMSAKSIGGIHFQPTCVSFYHFVSVGRAACVRR